MKKYLEKLCMHMEIGSYTSEFIYCGRLNSGLLKDVADVILDFVNVTLCFTWQKRHC